ncbi:MAG TPA: anhydro-N-acetylmuramic acid kinase [Sphingobacteriaceae bacterium]
MIQKLSEMAARPSRMVIGLMSGTSLDGLDIALCRISGSGPDTRVEVLNFDTIPYRDDFRTEVRSVFSRRDADLEKVCLLNASIGRLHAALINDFLERHGIAPGDVDCIASHGQTIYHAPRRLHGDERYPDATLQIGDGDHIAVGTGIITLSDFRQKHLAGGGEGAPLALYGDYLMFTSPLEDRVLLNMGGISNFTFLPRDGNGDRIISTDIGPGNTLIDALTQQYFGMPYDKDGLIARSGRVREDLLERMLAHPFFGESLPKTTGPELFNLGFIGSAAGPGGLETIDPRDLVATAAALTARSIVQVLEKEYPGAALSLYASGGGAHNPVIMEEIRRRLPHCTLGRSDDLGIAGDAKEAVLFAVLANETLCGSMVRIGSAPAVTMGKISLPV